MLLKLSTTHGRHSMQNMQTSTFSERLRTILDETGIRQTDLCDKAGIGKSAMSQYLHGAFIPKQAKLSAIAEALGVSEGWLMGYDVPRMRSTHVNPDGTISSECAEEYIEMFSYDNSMQSAHIPEGARVILRKPDEGFGEGEALKGEIVGLCMNGGRPMLRFLHKDGDKLLATAADIGYPPQVFDMAAVESGEVEVLGIVDRVEIRF